MGGQQPSKFLRHGIDDDELIGFSLQTPNPQMFREPARLDGSESPISGPAFHWVNGQHRLLRRFGTTKVYAYREEAASRTTSSTEVTFSLSCKG